LQTLDLVLPCYNPLPDWERVVVQSVQKIQAQLIDIEIVLFIVNDGSVEGIEAAHIDFIRKNIKQFNYIHYEKNHGKGYALRKGVAAGNGDFCIYTDIDFPYTDDSLVALFHRLNDADAEVVAGVRNEAYYAGVPVFRRRLSKALRYLLKRFFRLPISDTQCGLKGFSNAGRKIFLETSINRYLFDLEFIHLAAQYFPKKIAPIKVTLKPNIVFSAMNIRLLYREGLNLIYIIMKRKKT